MCGDRSLPDSQGELTSLPDHTWIREDRKKREVEEEKREGEREGGVKRVEVRLLHCKIMHMLMSCNGQNVIK